MADHKQHPEHRLLFNQASFIKSAARLSQCPPDYGAEVAFAGRSNAGKSSAINSLTGVSKLARTSKTPGRTQLLNFFEIGNPNQRLVDLPGYGYAKVPERIKAEWQAYMQEYLAKRETLKGLVLVMDVRHPLTSFDTMMAEWALNSQMPLHILLTKADKLKKGPAKASFLQVKKHFQGSPLVSVQLYSALKKEGVDEVRKVLQNWLKWDAEAEIPSEVSGNSEASGNDENGDS